MKRKRLMIIDDDKEFLEELNETLSLSGYDLVAVNDANQALKIALETRPAVILTDLKMPRKSGFQLAEEFKRRSELREIPIMAMSAFYKDGDFPLMKIYGIETCLNKPFTPEALICEIEKVLKEEK